MGRLVRRRWGLAWDNSGLRLPPPQVIARMKPLLVVLLGAFSLSACGQAPDPETGGADAIAVEQVLDRPEIEVEPGTPEARALEAIHAINPQVQVDSVQ